MSERAEEGKAGEGRNAGFREAQEAYMPLEKRQGKYTREDLERLPDGQRAELIDGVIYDMSSPSPLHQLIGGQIFRAFSDYIERKKGFCVPVFAPLDVQLDCDDRTMVQPDVLIVCDREKFQKGIVLGAPDLVVEILSKATRRKDMTIKVSKYAAAGVREYWIVDPDKRKVIVYEFEDEMNVSVYGSGCVVPVGIFGGDCGVDFGEIDRYVGFLYEIQ